MNSREARKQRRREQVREEILEAAKRVLLARGIAGMTLSAVARELQLTKAALYHYFDSKETLVFELTHRSMKTHAEIVGRAVSAAATGADALEALIRTSFEYYAPRLDELRLAYLARQVGAGSAGPFKAEQLARFRPLNDLMYGAVGAQIRVDQDAGRVASRLDGRRLAFIAHMSVIGVLTMEGLVAVADTAPLIHGRQAMVDELVSTYRARLSSASA